MERKQANQVKSTECLQHSPREIHGGVGNDGQEQRGRRGEVTRSSMLPGGMGQERDRAEVTGWREG